MLNTSERPRSRMNAPPPRTERNVICFCILDLHELCHSVDSAKRLRTNDIGHCWRATKTKALPQLRRFAAMGANRGIIYTQCDNERVCSSTTRSSEAKFKRQREMIRCGDRLVDRRMACR